MPITRLFGVRVDVSKELPNVVHTLEGLRGELMPLPDTKLLRDTELSVAHTNAIHNVELSDSTYYLPLHLWSELYWRTDSSGYGSCRIDDAISNELLQQSWNIGEERGVRWKVLGVLVTHGFQIPTQTLPRTTRLDVGSSSVDPGGLLARGSVEGD